MSLYHIEVEKVLSIEDDHRVKALGVVVDVSKDQRREYI